MPNNVSFESVEQVASNKFVGKFRNVPDAPNESIDRFRAFSLKLIPTCEDGFWPWSDCSVDEDNVREELGTAPYEQEVTGPNIYYSTKIKRESIEEVGDCVIIKYRWEMWGSHFSTLPEGEVTVTVTTPIGDITAEGNAGFIAHYSGEFHVKICCDEDCNPIITLLGEEDGTAGSESGESESDEEEESE